MTSRVYFLLIYSPISVENIWIFKTLWTIYVNINPKAHSELVLLLCIVFTKPFPYKHEILLLEHSMQNHAEIVLASQLLPFLLNCTALHWTALHCTELNWTALCTVHYTVLHHCTAGYTVLHHWTPGCTVYCTAVYSEQCVLLWHWMVNRRAAELYSSSRKGLSPWFRVRFLFS